MRIGLEWSLNIFALKQALMANLGQRRDGCERYNVKDIGRVKYRESTQGRKQREMGRDRGKIEGETEGEIEREIKGERER